MNKNSIAKHILIVDDDKDLIFTLKKTLEMHNYLVTATTNSQDALDVVKTSTIDLVISDIVMPGGSGIGLLLAIREAKPELPVIILTGQSRINSAIECIRLGAKDFLGKPFTPEKLVKAIKNGLTRNSESIDKTVKSDSSGRILGGYKVVRKIGKGNFGNVFLAEKKKGNTVEQYALKILKPATIFEDDVKKYQERFQHEAEAASRVKHPNVVNFVEYGLADNETVPFIVMEYFPGKSLKDFMKQNGRLDYRQKILIILQIAEALAAIHAAHICHRDIKPGNVLIDNNQKVKLIDFGTARLPESELTLTSDKLGTPYYLSPEGFISAKVDRRSDIYSLGVVAYELLLGEKPFVASSVHELSNKVNNEIPKEPKEIASDFPPSLQPIIAKMLKKDKHERYQTVQDVISDINDFLSSKGFL